MAEMCRGDSDDEKEKAMMKNWVVLFVRTGLEAELVRTLKERLNDEVFFPFVPTVETPYRKKGKVQKVRKPLFPGYIFLQTAIEPTLIAETLADALAETENIYSLLHYGDNKQDVVVREEERLHWERLFDENFCIVGSTGFIDGDTVRVTSGALVGLEGQIKKINRHKRSAIVEMEMMGARREVTLMLEIVAKT